MQTLRYARTYKDELNLVVSPPDLDCIGEKCRVAAQLGRCFITRHHVYFPHRLVLADQSEITQEFVTHPFNIAKMARCRHNIYHRQIDIARTPSQEVMAEFLKEARVLQRLGVVLNALDMVHGILVDDEKLDQITDTNRFEERWEQITDESFELQQMVRGFEIVPQRTIEREIGARAILLGTDSLAA